MAENELDLLKQKIQEKLRRWRDPLLLGALALGLGSEVYWLHSQNIPIIPSLPGQESSQPHQSVFDKNGDVSLVQGVKPDWVQVKEIRQINPENEMFSITIEPGQIIEVDGDETLEPLVKDEIQPVHVARSMYFLINTSKEAISVGFVSKAMVNVLSYSTLPEKDQGTTGENKLKEDMTNLMLYRAAQADIADFLSNPDDVIRFAFLKTYETGTMNLWNAGYLRKLH